MKIESIILVKTPLDNEYKNVYYYTLGTIYRNFLLGFPYERVAQSLVKSVKSDNTYFNCVLMKSIHQLKDYNYAIIVSDGSYYYYFVNRFESLNDSTENPSCRIFLEKDVFSNYMSTLRGENTPNKILKTHVDDTIYKPQAPAMICQNNLTNEKELPTIRKIKDNSRILWLKITTGREVKFSSVFIPDSPAPEDINADYRGSGSNPMSSQVKVFYVPFIAPNAKYAYIKVKDESSDGYRYFKIKTLKDSRDDIYGILTSSDETLGIELTYYAPFNYSYQNVEGEYSVVFTYNSDIDGNKFLFGYFYGDDTSRTLLYEQNVFSMFPNVDDNKVIFLCAVEQNNLNRNKFDFSVYLRESLPNNIDNVDKYDVSISDYCLYEPRLYEFPYKYKSLYYNNEFHDIIPESSASNYKIEIDYFNRPHALLRTYFDVFNSTPNIKYEILNRNGEMQLVADSKEYYLRNNGASIGANNINALAKSIKSKNPLIGFETMISSAAAIIDADNAKDSYSEPSVNALDDIIYQDGVFEVDVESYPNTYLYNQQGEEFRYYGVNLNRYEKLIEEVRTDFRYVKTENCTIPSVSNIDDRKKLEAIFNRGLTIWNIRNPAAPSIERPSARTLDKTGYNLPITLYKYYKGDL